MRPIRPRHCSSYWSSRRRATQHRLEICSNDLAASDARLGHQARPLEDRDVLLHGGEAHRVVLGKLGDALAAVDRPANDVAPGQVGEGAEEPVEVGRCNLHRYNHTVVLRVLSSPGSTTHRTRLGSELRPGSTRPNREAAAPASAHRARAAAVRARGRGRAGTRSAGSSRRGRGARARAGRARLRRRLPTASARCRSPHAGARASPRAGRRPRSGDSSRRRRRGRLRSAAVPDERAVRLGDERSARDPAIRCPDRVDDLRFERSAECRVVDGADSARLDMGVRS